MAGSLIKLALAIPAFLTGCGVMKHTHLYEFESLGWHEITWEAEDGQRCATAYYANSLNFWTVYAFNDNSTQHHFGTEQEALDFAESWCKP